jgi:hypothetical protein
MRFVEIASYRLDVMVAMWLNLYFLPSGGRLRNSLRLLVFTIRDSDPWVEAWRTRAGQFRVIQRIT